MRRTMKSLQEARQCRKSPVGESVLSILGMIIFDQHLTSIWPAFDRDWSNTFEHHRKDGNDWPESWFLPMNDRKCEWLKFHISLVFTAFYSSLWQTKIGRSSNASAYCVQRPLLASRWSGQILSWCNFWLRPWHVERKSSPDEVGCFIFGAFWGHLGYHNDGHDRILEPLNPIPAGLGLWAGQDLACTEDLNALLYWKGSYRSDLRTGRSRQVPLGLRSSPCISWPISSSEDHGSRWTKQGSYDHSFCILISSGHQPFIWSYHRKWSPVTIGEDSLACKHLGYRYILSLKVVLGACPNLPSPKWVYH